MADLGDDIFFATIPELNARLVKREISAEEVARAFSARLQQLGPRYNALALPRPQQALKQAKAVDGDIKRGRLRGPLQGIPWGAKDVLSVAGEITTWGAKPYAAQVFDYTATAIQKLEGVGALLTGKLSLVELAGGPEYRYAAASLFGPGLNPWDKSRWSGGSSSGSASAVAAGLVTFALGSETSGSIVTPASYCGVTGLRPTYGLVSRYGAMPLSWTLDKIGPLAHSAEDCGLILQAIAGSDSKDPGSAGKSFYYTPQYARPLKELKVGYAPIDFTDRADASARPAFAAALAAFKESGVTLVEMKLPEFQYGLMLWAILIAESGSVFEPLVASGGVDQLADALQIAGLKASLDIAAKDYLKAMRLRGLAQAAFRKLFSQVDALLTVGRPGPATTLDTRLDEVHEVPGGLDAIVPAGNLAGLPAVIFPCGFAGNLPVALQVVGTPFSENTILAMARAFQEKTDWHRKRPPTA